MNGLLCYFSGTGNTKWIADNLVQELEMSGYHTTLVNMEQVQSIDLNGYDFLIVGTPVYAEAPPPFVETFVKRLPDNQGRIVRCMVYSDQGAVTVCAAKRLSSIMTTKGYPVTVEALFRMPNNYYFGAGIMPTEDKIERYLRAAKELAKETAAAFVAGNKRLCHASPLHLGYGRIAASIFRRMMPKLGKKLSASADCNGCGLCERRCPQQNIRIDNNRARFGDRCMLCTRCIHLCPVNAILYDGKQVEQTQKEIIKVLDR